MQTHIGASCIMYKQYNVREHMQPYRLYTRAHWREVEECEY